MSSNEMHADAVHRDLRKSHSPLPMRDFPVLELSKSPVKLFFSFVIATFFLLFGGFALYDTLLVSGTGDRLFFAGLVTGIAGLVCGYFFGKIALDVALCHGAPVVIGREELLVRYTGDSIPYSEIVKVMLKQNGIMNMVVLDCISDFRPTNRSNPIRWQFFKKLPLVIVASLMRGHSAAAIAEEIRVRVEATNAR